MSLLADDSRTCFDGDSSRRGEMLIVASGASMVAKYAAESEIKAGNSVTPQYRTTLGTMSRCG